MMQKSTNFTFMMICKKKHEHYFSEHDDVYQRLYLLLSNCEDLPQQCSRLVEEFISYTEKTVIPMGRYR
jgi:hypothetical protein